MNLGSRVRNALKLFVAIEIIVIGTISSVSTIIPFIGWQAWISLSFVATVAIALLSWLKTKPVQLAEDVISDIDKEDGRTSVEVPTPRDLLMIANSHAHGIFGDDALRFDDIEKWWKKNPFVEAVLRSECGEYLGYFDILPLNDEAAKSLESGEILERDIKPEQILGPREMKKANVLYLAGIVAKDAGTELGKTRAAKLFCGLVSYMRFYYGHKARRVLALAATTSGERLLRNIKARIVCSGCVRKDGHDLYEIWVTPQLLTSLNSRARKRGCPARLDFHRTKQDA